MSDSASIAIAIGPATVVGVVSYLVARLQFVSARQVRVDEHRRKRQDAYHRLLLSILAWDRLLRGFDSPTPKHITELGEESQACLELVYLLAPEDVVQLAIEWGELRAAITEGAAERTGPISDRLSEVHAEVSADFTKLRNQLIEAMRDDVGPHAVT